MSISIRSLRIVVSLVSLFVLLQVQVSSAQQSAARNTASTAMSAEPQAAGQSVSSPSQVVPALPVPRLIKFSGVAKDASGQPRSGTVGITFSIYASQEGGAPLWMETQNLELDARGHYAVLLGTSQSAGLPLDLFATGEPRWLGAKVELPGEVEQPRVLLVSVPYALKASDADTVGGMPASAFVLAPTGSGAGADASAPGTKSKAAKSKVSPEFTSSGTATFIPIFTDSSGDLGNSNIYQSATGNYVINAPSGGNVLNSTNFSDQDMIVALTPPGASDKHAYFGPGTNTNLTLGVGGVEKMRINSAGNVGIGYSNPQQRLVIGAPSGGVILNSSNLSDQDLNLLVTPPGASTKYTFFGPSVSTNLAVGVNLTPMMWIANSGNVGINTTTPYALLDVEGGTANVYNSSGNGDGLDSYSANGAGISTTSNDPLGSDGIDSSGSYYGGYFYGPAGGSFSENDTDSSFSAAAYGFEFGSTQENFGMVGFSASAIGIGTYGQAVEASNEGANTDGGFFPLGVWGDSGVSAGIGVFGSADDGWAVVGYNNSPSGDVTAYFENDESTSSTFPVLYTYGGNYGGHCDMDVSGNLHCSGTITAVVPVAGGAKKVALNGIQSPENWFEDAGGAQLSGGEAVVNIESVFGETVNTGVDYRVFLTPNGDCKGLYVAQKSATSFVVRELGGGTSSIAFDYRIMAKRRGFEQVRLVDETERFSGKNRPARSAGSAAKRMPSAHDLQKKVQEHAKRHLVAQASTPPQRINNSFVMPRSSSVQKPTAERQ